MANPTTRQGWQCPGCHRCYSPDVRECDVCAKNALLPIGRPSPAIPEPIPVPPHPGKPWWPYGPPDPWGPWPVISWEYSTGTPPLVLCETTSASGERRPGYSGDIAHYRWAL